jgi:type IV pilus assembly protein PilV
MVAGRGLLGHAQGWKLLMRTRPTPQQGSFMLESLVALLIVSLGVLGIVGLYARSAQNLDDAKYRGEAALLAHSLVGQMWVTHSSSATLQANFDSAAPGTGAGYVEFRSLVLQRLPNSLAPDVLVTAGPSATSSNVQITIKWTQPGDMLDPLLPKPRKYDLIATIGSNL